jgi:hypothetical protein
MSSIESMISEIESDYEQILESFETHLSQETVLRFKDMTEEYVLKLLRRMMNFQKKLEYFVTSTLRLTSKTRYNTDRLKEIRDRVLARLESNTAFETVKFYSGSFMSYEEIEVLGIIPLLESSHRYLLKENKGRSQRLCYCGYFGFKLMRSDLIELEEELRLISALTTYPIENKLKLKNQLVMHEFEEVAVSLEEAESNIENEHFKDSVSRCRDALEIFVAFIRERETGEKTDKHFATDLGKIVKIEVFDEAIQRLAQGVYSFLSIKGSHKYDAKKVTIYDAETSLNETYSLLEMLLQKYLDLKKTKKKIKNSTTNL